MSDYIVDRIPGKVRIDPDAGGKERERKREKGRKPATEDSVSISEEARRRSAEQEGEELAAPQES